MVFWFWTFKLVSSVIKKSLSSAQSLMERKKVADSVSGFVFSFLLRLSLLFFSLQKSLAVRRKKSRRRSFGSSFAWNKELSIQVNFWNKLRHRKPKSSSAGFGSSTSGLEVQRAIDCATRTFGMSECYLKRWKDWVVLEWTHFALAFLFRPHLFRPTESRLHIIFCPCGLWREDCVVQL